MAAEREKEEKEEWGREKGDGSVKARGGGAGRSTAAAAAPGGAGQMIQFFLLVSRQGKCRLSKWYAAYSEKEKRKMVREVSQLCLNRPQKLCNFLGEPPAAAACAVVARRPVLPRAPPGARAARRSILSRLSLLACSAGQPP